MYRGGCCEPRSRRRLAPDLVAPRYWFNTRYGPRNGGGTFFSDQPGGTALGNRHFPFAVYIGTETTTTGIATMLPAGDCIAKSPKWPLKSQKKTRRPLEPAKKWGSKTPPPPWSRNGECRDCGRCRQKELGHCITKCALLIAHQQMSSFCLGGAFGGQSTN
jgi:hypothetical protein